MSAPRPPLAVQYVAALLPRIDASVLTLPPGSRAMREAIRAAGHAAGWPFTPTRLELLHALRTLEADGTLAARRGEARR